MRRRDLLRHGTAFTGGVSLAALINACDLSYPILLCAEGRVMDGMHRVARSHLEGRATVAARRFAVTPPHDHINVAPEDLSYD